MGNCLNIGGGINLTRDKNAPVEETSVRVRKEQSDRGTRPLIALAASEVSALLRTTQKQGSVGDELGTVQTLEQLIRQSVILTGAPNLGRQKGLGRGTAVGAGWGTRAPKP